MSPKKPMLCSIHSYPIPKWVIFIIFFTNLCTISFPQPNPESVTTELGLFCGGNSSSNSSYYAVFVQEMESLSQLINSQGWGTSSFLNSTPPMYGLAQCFGGLSQTDCISCYASIRTILPRCLPAISGRIYLGGCFLRYDSYAFYAEAIDPARDIANCTPPVRPIAAESSEVGFSRNVEQAIRVALLSAFEGEGYGVAEAKGGAETVYALAQCWRSVSKQGCRTCLERARNKSMDCLPSRDGRGLNAGCYLRYSTTKFYGQETGGSNKLSTGVIVAVVLGAVAVFIVSSCAAYAAYVKLSKLRKGRKNRTHISIAFRKSGFYFKYKTLEKATNYFDESRKLGQGGGGSVYMGKLSDGRTVAVKRLVFNTSQWVDEFFNEVNLIGAIRHKNLVKLLGCSIEGPESILVYEYVPNGSINDFMSDKGMNGTLNWKRRLSIIVGIAEGLAYLHGGTHIRIIHRDIKGSNVLLDENLDPKIADFGLIRCFGTDKTHLSTGVAGTLGYMAPEYLVRGQLTEKADVYSFGVLMLEIVCGRKSTVSIQGSDSLLGKVWKLYELNNLPEAADPSLGGDFPPNEASRVLQIGLLCIQGSAAARPLMEDVVQMLTQEGCNIPNPGRPPFMNASVLDSINSMMASSTNTSASIAPDTCLEGFTTSSASGPSGSKN